MHIGIIDIMIVDPRQKKSNMMSTLRLYCWCKKSVHRYNMFLKQTASTSTLFQMNILVYTFCQN